MPSSNPSYIFADKTLKGLNTIFTEIIIIRILGLEFYGDYIFFINAILLLMPIFLFSYENLITQSRVTYLLKPINFLFLSFLGGFCTCLIYFIFFDDNSYVVYFLFLFALLRLFSLAEFLHIRYGGFQYVFHARLVTTIIIFVVKLYLLFDVDNLSPIFFVIIYFFELCSIGIYLFIFKFNKTTKFIEIKKNISLLKLLILLMPLLVSAIFVSISTRLDLYFLNRFFDASDIAIYYSHLRGFEILAQLSVVMGMILTTKGFFANTNQSINDFFKIYKFKILIFLIIYALFTLGIGLLILNYGYSIDIDIFLCIAAWLNLVFISFSIIISRLQIFMSFNYQILWRSFSMLIVNGIILIVFFYFLELRSLTIILFSTALGQAYSLFISLFWFFKNGHTIIRI